MAATARSNGIATSGSSHDGVPVRRAVASSSLDAELDELRDWLDRFHEQHGRPLRVLHVGNIAGNAYLNAKFLRSVGVDADVLSHSYRHVMSFPEWEDADLRHSHGDDNNPRFSWSDKRRYQRPRWFVDGSLAVAVEKIRSRWSSNRLSLVRVFYIRSVLSIGDFLTDWFGVRAAGNLVLLFTRPQTFLSKMLNFARRFKTYGRSTGEQRHAGHQDIAYDSTSETSYKFVRDLCALFEKRFPDRADKLVLQDLHGGFSSSKRDYERMFAPYDVVQCYATFPISALITGKRPYVAFEHGTLRHFTMDDDPLHRLTALAYREADHTFITNGDCLAYAERLGIEDYSPIIHPVNVEQHRQDFSQEAAQIRAQTRADVLIFCPVRHDYDIKGTDVAIKALPLIKERLPERKVVMILADWGAQVEESRRMVEELGCADNVVWKSSMCRVAMIQHMQASDVVYDQFVLPVFGSTAPQAIAAGRPVIASYVPDETKWLIPEPAPIVSAFTPEELTTRTIECLDPAWLESYQERARDWTDRYHSPKNAIVEHLKVYRRVLAKYESPPD